MWYRLEINISINIGQVFNRHLHRVKGFHRMLVMRTFKNTSVINIKLTLGLNHSLNTNPVLLQFLHIHMTLEKLDKYKWLPMFNANMINFQTIKISIFHLSHHTLMYKYRLQVMPKNQEWWLHMNIWEFNKCMETLNNKNSLKENLYFWLIIKEVIKMQINKIF